MVVGGGLAGCARVVAVLDESEDVIDTGDCLLLQPHHLHLLSAVLQHTQLLLLVHQVKHLGQDAGGERGRTQGVRGAGRRG